MQSASDFLASSLHYSCITIQLNLIPGAITKGKPEENQQTKYIADDSLPAQSSGVIANYQYAGILLGNISKE